MKVSQTLLLSFSLLLSVSSSIADTSDKKNEKLHSNVGQSESEKPKHNSDAEESTVNDKSNKPVISDKLKENETPHKQVASKNDDVESKENVIGIDAGQTKQDATKEQNKNIVDSDINKPNVSNALMSRAKAVTSTSVNFLVDNLNKVGKKESAYLFALFGYVMSGDALSALRTYENGISKSLTAVTVLVTTYSLYKLYGMCCGGEEEQEEAIDFNLYGYEDCDNN